MRPDQRRRLDEAKEAIERRRAVHRQWCKAWHEGSDCTCTWATHELVLVDGDLVTIEIVFQIENKGDPIPTTLIKHVRQIATPHTLDSAVKEASLTQDVEAS